MITKTTPATTRVMAGIITATTIITMVTHRKPGRFHGGA
jgi:hypothetical protein